MSQSKTQQPESKPRDFHRLQDVVAELDAHSIDASHAVIVEALGTLAAAVASIASTNPSSTSRVPEIAKQLASSDPRSLEHADLVKEALALVTRRRVLDRYQRPLIVTDLDSAAVLAPIFERLDSATSIGRAAGAPRFLRSPVQP